MGVVGRRIARGGFVVVSRDVVANLVALVGSIVVARVLGPDEYGLASVALIYPGMVVGFASLGLRQALIRFSAAGSVRGESSRYISSGIILSLLSGLSASVVVLVFSPYFAGLLHRPVLEKGISVLSIYVFSIVLFNVVEGALLGLGRYEDTALAVVSRSVVRVSVAVFLAVALGFGHLAVLWGLSIGYFSCFAIGFWRLVRYTGIVRPGFGYARELLGYSLPLYLPTLVASPVTQAVMGFLAARASDFEMGNLSVANLLEVPVGIIGGALGTAVFSSLPVLLDDKDRLRLAVNKSVLYSNMLIVPSALGLALIAGPLVFLLYGSRYSLAPDYLFLLLFPYIYSAFASGAITWYANTIGDTRFTGMLTLVDLAVRVPVALVMIYWLGVTGYLLTSVIVNPVSAGIVLFLGSRRYGFVPWIRKNGLVGLWSGISFLIGLIVYLFVSEYLGIVVYVVGLLLTAKYFIDRDDLVEVVGLSRSIPLVGGIVSRMGDVLIRVIW